MVSGCWIVAHATQLSRSAQDDLRDLSHGLISDHCGSHSERPNHRIVEREYALTPMPCKMLRFWVIVGGKFRHFVALFP
jgi:hypothetical protein